MGEVLLFDTSALAKRYVREIGSTWVEAVGGLFGSEEAA